VAPQGAQHHPPKNSSGAIAGEDVLHHSQQACQFCRFLAGQLVAKKTIDNMEWLPSSGLSAQKNKQLLFSMYMSLR
jgi:hypothetical protein